MTETHIPPGYYFVDDADGGRLIRKESRHEMQQLIGGPQRKCPKCGSMLAHYRLLGMRCTNPACAGPYGGGR